jgi:hypothetical protein
LVDGIVETPTSVSKIIEISNMHVGIFYPIVKQRSFEMGSSLI